MTGGRAHSPFPIDHIIMTDRFFVLILDSGGARLFHGNSRGLSPLRFPHAVMMLDELVASPRLRGFGGQAAPGAGSRGGSRGEIGFQMNNRERWGLLCDYFRQLEASVLSLIGEPGAPLVLAGADHLITAYRAASRYSTIVPTAIVGEGIASDTVDLHARVMKIVGLTHHQAVSTTTV